jgi:hypothetical protein
VRRGLLAPHFGKIRRREQRGGARAAALRARRGYDPIADCREVSG